MVGNSASKPLESRPIELPCITRLSENCVEDAPCILEIHSFTMVFLNICNCANNAHFRKSGHICIVETIQTHFNHSFISHVHLYIIISYNSNHKINHYTTYIHVM